MSVHKDRNFEIIAPTMSILRTATLLVFLASAPAWGQSSSAPAQASDSNQQAAQTSQTPPDSNKNPPADQSPSAVPPDSTKLEPIKTQKASYPLEARALKLQGEVVVKIVVSATGEVESAVAVSGDPILAKSAADAAMKWKFKPFIKNGKPVKVSTKLPFDFAFSDKVHDEKLPPADQTAPAAPPPVATTAGPDKPKLAIPQRVRVAQGVSAGLLLYKVQPAYPPDAQQARIQGTVVLRALISKDGKVENLSLVSGHPMLAPAAIGAVQQWRYKPYLLNGQPVEVSTEVLVNFQLR
jgi:TonB family protein